MSNFTFFKKSENTAVINLTNHNIGFEDGADIRWAIPSGFILKTQLVNTPKLFCRGRTPEGEDLINQILAEFKTMPETELIIIADAIAIELYFYSDNKDRVIDWLLCGFFSGTGYTTIHK